MTTFFGFAISDSMFAGDCNLTRKELSIEKIRWHLSGDIVVCFNPLYKVIIDVMEKQFDIKVVIFEKPPVVNLSAGDKLIVLLVGGLSRLIDRHEYIDEKIAKAMFKFVVWTVMTN